MNKYIKLIVLLLTLIFAVPCVVNALDINITVEEQNGIEVKDYFFRRGVPLEKGCLYSADDICLTENGEEITSSAEVLQKHPDGSISWLLISANVDLQPNEIKNLVISNGKTKTSTTQVTRQDSKITVKSKHIEVTAGSNGIESLYYDNKQMLNSSINVFANVDQTVSYLNSTDISVLKHTESYVKLKLKGNINDKLEGEMYITVADGAEKFEVEYRIIAKDNVDVLQTGLKIGAAYKETGIIINNDCLELGAMQLVSYDNTRFRGAASDAQKTGYIINGNEILHSPLINGRTKLFYDGVARTNHIYFTFSNDCDSWDKTLVLMPKVNIPPKQFVKAGQIKSADTGALVDDAINTLKFSYKRRNGRFEAGAISRVINPIYGLTDSYDSQAGEVAYNMGLAYMQTGDAEIYRYVDECVEARADIVIYKGKYPEVYGEARTRMGQFTNDAAFSGHAYYGDQSALYMGYILTGNEYVGEIYKASMEHDIKYMYDVTACGTYVPRTWAWSRDASSKPKYLTYYESRGGIRARAMYLAYLHFGDERYLKAAREIVQWMANVQLENGSFLQATYNNGIPLMQAGQTQYPNKDYISLYGIRGVSQILEFDETEALAKEVTLKFADYICLQNETFGPGIWYPNGDVNVYAVNENDTRGKSPMTDILAVDLLCTAFEVTGEERYLKNILSLLESYMCTATGGFSFWYTALENTPWVVSDEVDSSRCSSLFKSSDNIITIIQNNKQKAIELGYENVVAVFDADAKKCSNAEILNYSYPEVTQNIFENDDIKVFFAANNFAPLSGDWEKNLRFVFDDNRLWQGEKNVVDDAYSVTLAKYTKQYDTLTAIQRPVYVDEVSGTSNIWITDYSADKIELLYSGTGELGLRIMNGLFEIRDNSGYSIQTQKTSKGVRVVITKGGEKHSCNGALYLRLSKDGNLIENVGLDALKGTSLADASADTQLTAEQLKAIIYESFGMNISLSSPVWNEFAPALAGVTELYGMNAFKKSGVKSITAITPKADVTDEQAVQLAAEVINVEYDGDKLQSDVFLAEKSLYDCTVSWKSDNEKVLTSKGVLNRNNIDCDSVTLTATIKKNNASVTKSFVIPLVPKEVVLQKPSSNITETAFSLIPQYGTAEITFSCTPKRDNIDGIIVIGDSDYPSDSLANVSYMIRFAPKGYIDAVNDYNSSMVNKVYYEAGKKYTFRVIMRMNEGTYDAYVAPEGGTETLIAKNYTPRNTGNTVKKADVMWLWTSSLDSYELDYCSHYQYKKTAVKNNYLYDEYNLMFGKYNVDNSLSIPENSGFVHTKCGVSHKIGDVNVYFAGAGISTAVDALKAARLVDWGYYGNEQVTAGDIARILSAKQCFDNTKEITTSIPGITELYGDDFNGCSGDYVYKPNIAGQSFAGLELLPSATRPVGATISAENQRVEFGSDDVETLLLHRCESGQELTESFVVEFDYCQTVIGDNNINTLYKCTDRDGKMYGVWLTSKGGYLTVYNETTERRLCKLEENRLYNFKIYVDPIIKEFSVYIDGKCFADHFKLQSDLSSIGRLFWVSCPAGTSRFYIDNFSIYKDTREDVLFSLCKEMKNLVVASDTISLPTSENDGVHIDWSSMNSSIIDTATGKVTRGDEDVTVILTATVVDDEWVLEKSLDFEVVVKQRAETIDVFAAADFNKTTSVARGEFVDNNLLSVSSNGAVVDSGRLKIDKSASSLRSANLYMDYNVKNNPAVVTVEFDFMTETAQAISTVFSMSGMVNDTGYLNAVQLTSDTKNIYYVKGLDGGGVQRTVLINNYKPEVWYKFKLIVDETTKTYDVYENGVCLAENIKFCPEVGSTPPSRVTRPFMTDSGSNVTKAYYIDNFVVYNYTDGPIGTTVTYDSTTKKVTGSTLRSGKLSGYEAPMLVLAIYNNETLVETKKGTIDGDYYKADISVKAYAPGVYKARAFLFENEELSPLCLVADKEFTVY